MKIRSIQELLKEVGIQAVCKVFCEYAYQYIDKVNLNGIDSIEDDTPYRKKLIQCIENDYSIMNKLFELENFNIEYAINNNEFLQFMIRLSNTDAYDTEITDKLRSKLSINNNDYKTLNDKSELANINDNVNDKFRILNKKFYDNIAVLYINGEVLTGDTLHINLLMEYLDNYSNYKHLKDISKIKDKIYDWNDLDNYDIPAIRLYKYNFGNVCEYLSSYGINDISPYIKQVADKLNCKVYMFASESNLDIRIAKRLK